MTKIDIFSGFLGAGKTTLIKKLLKDGYNGQKIVLIENEFGEIGIDGGFLKEAGVQVNEMNSGCICCSLVGDFSKALTQVITDYNPDRILIEPSGVGKLSDVIRAVRDTENLGAELGAFVTIADATKCKMYMKNFGEFYNDQIENACTIILSRTDGMAQDKIDTAVSLLREHNDDAVIVTTPWDELTGQQILAAMENKNTLEIELQKLSQHEHEHHHHHDHDHDHDEHDCCHHDHDHEEHKHHHHDGEECHCHEHEHEHEHHHHDGEECHCHEHEHEHHHHDHHEHDHHHEGHEHHGHEHHYDEHGNCSCGHHHHHADEVFASWGVETTHKFTKECIENCLKALENQAEYGIVLRAKGIVQNADGGWIHYDYVPGCPDVRDGGADITGRICVIGSEIDEHKLAQLFGVA